MISLKAGAVTLFNLFFNNIQFMRFKGTIPSLTPSYSVNLFFIKTLKIGQFHHMLFQRAKVWFRIPSSRFQQVAAEFQQDSMVIYWYLTFHCLLERD